MTVKDRIEQLERRIAFLNKQISHSWEHYTSTHRTLRLNRIKALIGLCEGQLQALRWVEESQRYKDELVEHILSQGKVYIEREDGSIVVFPPDLSSARLETYTPYPPIKVD